MRGVDRSPWSKLFSAYAPTRHAIRNGIPRKKTIDFFRKMTIDSSRTFPRHFLTTVRPPYSGRISLDCRSVGFFCSQWRALSFREHRSYLWCIYIHSIFDNRLNTASIHSSSQKYMLSFKSAFDNNSEDRSRTVLWVRIRTIRFRFIRHDKFTIKYLKTKDPCSLFRPQEYLKKY